MDILTPERVSVATAAEGVVQNKAAALERLAQLLALGQEQVSEQRILLVLSEREKLQSTGVGGGVAVPHGSMQELSQQIGALLVCPKPIEFDAIDGEPVSILFALIGPKGSPAEHLKILARISRILREASFRQQLAQVESGSDAFELIRAIDRPTAPPPDPSTGRGVT